MHRETNRNLEEEAERATKILHGKIVNVLWRHSEKQVGIQFTDGTRLFVDHSEGSVEVSIT